ncbi:MAG: hypothetical protein K6E64_03850 [Lachnospiraceae bacterium]|nr:hypothetical protein [Lachnospiraceae bacterium]
MEQQQPDQYYIPDNYSDEHQFRGIPYRNIIEALIVVYVFYKLIQATPFVLSIRLTAVLIVCGGLGVFFLIGIKGESVTQFFLSFLKYRENKKTYHLRPVGYKTAKEKKREDKNDKFKKAIKGSKEKVKEITGIFRT